MKAAHETGPARETGGAQRNRTAARRTRSTGLVPLSQGPRRSSVPEKSRAGQKLCVFNVPSPISQQLIGQCSRYSLYWFKRKDDPRLPAPRAISKQAFVLPPCRHADGSLLGASALFREWDDVCLSQFSQATCPQEMHTGCSSRPCGPKPQQQQ